jgi:hypothetical protein
MTILSSLPEARYCPFGEKRTHRTTPNNVSHRRGAPLVAGKRPVCVLRVQSNFGSSSDSSKTESYIAFVDQIRILPSAACISHYAANQTRWSRQGDDTDAACCKTRSVRVNMDRINGHLAFVACRAGVRGSWSEAHVP